MTDAPALASAAPTRPTAGAGDPILTSKIVVPGVPGWLIARPRLEKLIAQGTQGPITTVTGPPGAGKTMALAQWAAADPSGHPIAWVTLDNYDKRPRAFWSYVMAALRKAGVTVPRALSAAACRYAIDHEFLLRCASVMAAQDPPVTLVLDDVHLLTGSKVVDGLAYVLMHGKPGLRLVLSSRVDPLLPLHRYRLTGELTEIRASDLAFTVDESRVLLAQHGVTLSAESLEGLTRRTEGWAALIRMAAMSMDGHSDPEQFVKGLAAEDSAVTGYLVEEVLNAQSADVRNFLLRTSILDRVSEDIVRELVGNRQDVAVLADLARANPLVQRDDGGWYRYHSLFAAVLRLKLRRENPGRVADLHLRAAKWYRRNGALAEAVQHAADAGEWEFAARTVVDELAVGRLLEPRGDEALTLECRRIPSDLGHAEPQSLLVTAAIDFAQGRDGPCCVSLSTAESLLENLPADEEVPSRLAAALIHLALSRRTGDFGEAPAAASQAQVMIEAVSEDQLAQHPMVRAQVLSACGIVKLWSGDFEAAAAIFESGAAAARTAHGANEQADCLGPLALIEALRGRFNRAGELAAEAVGTAEDEAGQPVGPASRAAEVALAFVHLERADVACTHLHLKQAHDALRNQPDKLIGAVACLVAARESLAEGRPKAALEIIGRVRQGWTPPAWIEHRLTLLGSWAQISIGDFSSAVEGARRAGAGSSLGVTVALARALLASGDAEAARKVLPAVPSGEAAGELLSAWLVDAQLSYASGDRIRGRRCLEHALLLGEAEQQRLPFVMERTWLQPVLRRDPEFVGRYRRLLEPDVISPGWPDAGPSDAGQAAPLIVEPLSDREREILQYVSAMESNAEIADRMYISVNTVKSHLKSAYRKLAATHRSQAVRRARELGLL
jgi:LuxR family transcriptional regulator, maltose regulon positive regulatory protein